MKNRYVSFLLGILFASLIFLTGTNYYMNTQDTNNELTPKVTGIGGIFFFSDDPAKAKALQAEGDVLFKKALPYLQKANEIDKCDGDTLRALLQLTINLQLTDEYKKYKDIEKACKGG